MPRYRYTYLNAKERRKQDWLEALHIQEAREKLAQQGVQLLSIREVPPRRVRIKNSELIICSKQMLLLLRSGLPLYESLSSLRDQYQGQGMSGVLTAFMENLRSGGSLSQAMAAYPAIFDNFYRSAVLAGESVGNLEGCLQNIIAVLEEREQMSKKLMAALSYPIVLLVFSLAVILFFLTGVIPSLKETFENMEPNTLTSIVFGLSDFVCKYKYLLLATLGAGIASIVVTRRKPFWKKWFEKTLFSIPGVKKFFIKLGFSRFCSVVSAILRGGGTLIEGLELGCGAVPYDMLREDMTQIIHAVIEGSSLSKELAKRPWVPKLALGMVSLGEESGELADVLGHVAHIYNEDTQKTLTCITSWCQPVILVFLGGIIGIIMLAILIPLTSNIQIL
ncbi:Cholera toxin secretion protein epsF,type IV pilin biogenesis protein,type II secretion system protein F,Bacterial type II secretion system protein F domain [Chlamydia poikilotherma]|uniref:Cholera toxin secretion protein epsF,type IV pilin biogenesis protein,type II secretion system protein F,Bacterial type II secretion system protein F domain n=1 Tax=Chlamydia poikilotherma TaxID=1967783 RepID=A0A3B0Q1L2_9CHLA|nr:type II secretion system F family protein [Chlamydia poikilotherma]SYX09405.1 Cholera toxin secretion protein epsF,type IV pilin biogenesis protein,type II secretion system protein F,Bacterial type II secretion system protein F domain [Chlamydia poikilotherma]